MKPVTKALLEGFARKKTLAEDGGDPEMIAQGYGGNVDDAYECGMESGQIILAREILKMEQ